MSKFFSYETVYSYFEESFPVPCTLVPLSSMSVALWHHRNVIRREERQRLHIGEWKILKPSDSMWTFPASNSAKVNICHDEQQSCWFLFSQVEMSNWNCFSTLCCISTPLWKFLFKVIVGCQQHTCQSRVTALKDLMAQCIFVWKCLGTSQFSFPLDGIYLYLWVYPCRLGGSGERWTGTAQPQGEKNVIQPLE